MSGKSALRKRMQEEAGMKKSCWCTSLAIAILILGFLGSFILAVALGRFLPNQNWKLILGVMVGGGVPTAFTAGALLYTAAMLEEISFLKSLLQKAVKDIRIMNDAVDAMLDDQLQKNHRWRCPVCGKIHGEEVALCCGKRKH